MKEMLAQEEACDLLLLPDDFLNKIVLQTHSMYSNLQPLEAT